jgi:uncharacterized membrane protein
MNPSGVDQSGMEPSEHELLSNLRRLRGSLRQQPPEECLPVGQLTLGQKVADAVADVMGSWTFIIIRG